MPIPYSFLTADDIAPFYDAAAVTPSDSTDLPIQPRSLYIGGSGTLVVDMQGGATVTFTAVPVGILEIRARRVRATGTTATNILALY